MEQPAIERQQHRVIVVDDHAATRYALARGLRAAGFDAVEAATGGEGLDLASSASALVLDVNLPDIHGHEVCRRLRRNAATRNLPVVHVSAISLKASDRLLAQAVGADAYLTAPVDSAVLAQTLDRLIARNGSSEPGRRSGRGARTVLTMMNESERLRNTGGA